MIPSCVYEYSILKLSLWSKSYVNKEWGFVKQLNFVKRLRQREEGLLPTGLPPLVLSQFPWSLLSHLHFHFHLLCFPSVQRNRVIPRNCNDPSYLTVTALYKHSRLFDSVQLNVHQQVLFSSISSYFLKTHKSCMQTLFWLTDFNIEVSQGWSQNINLLALTGLKIVGSFIINTVSPRLFKAVMDVDPTSGKVNIIVF